MITLYDSYAEQGSLEVAEQFGPAFEGAAGGAFHFAAELVDDDSGDGSAHDDNGSHFGINGESADGQGDDFHRFPDGFTENCCNTLIYAI